MIKGYLNFILHSHIPWVLGYGRWPHGLDWLSEATTESYIPLLNQIVKLINEGYSPHLNIGITPILQEQLQSSDFIVEFEYYLRNKIVASENDIKEFSKGEKNGLLPIAEMWRNYYAKILEDFRTTYDGSIINSLRRLQNQGYIEIITSAATHGYLPLLKYDRSVEAQINCGAKIYKHYFGQESHGIWLPECAYRPSYKWTPPAGNDKTSYDRKGIDELLSKYNIEYFIIDSHLLKGGKAIGVYLSRFKALRDLWRHFKREFVEIKEDFEKSPYENYLVSSNPHLRPLIIFTRDPVTALQVWSGELGYPGDSHYLDFHKKRFPGGLKYWRVTNPKIDLASKEIYDLEVVENILKGHARNFVSMVKNIAEKYYKTNHKPALICTPFDTELFGHWWFEGPRWLYYVLKYVEEDTEIALVTGTAAIKKIKSDKVVSLPEGSWGEGGFHYIWLNQWTNWTWQKIYDAEDQFYALYDKYINSPSKMKIRILKQLGRELLLLQSSDWQFLISTQNARDYAEYRFNSHFENFKQLASFLEKGKVEKKDISVLNNLEKKDSCFQNMDLSVFAP